VLASAARRTWRRSLQVRMVTYTLVASSLLIIIFGVVVATRIQGGLIDTRLKSAQEQLAGGQVYAEKQLDAYWRPDDSDLARSVQGVLDNLTQFPGFGNGGAAVMIPATLSIPFNEMYAGTTNNSVVDVITPEIRDLVADGHRAHQFVTIDLGNDGPQPALVVGTPVNVTVGTFELYYVLPMNTEVASASLTRNTVIITGVALVGLLAIMAALITRVVVNPVRDAARTAQRLSAGLLDQRMEVRGEDDLARLAASFNQMAINLQRQIVRLEEMSRLQRRFTSDVSHELRTPLTTVRMAADLLYTSRDELDPLMARSAELLNAELDRFEELLTDLLEISRFDAGFAVLDAEPTDLVAIVNRVVERLTALARHVGISLQVNTPTGAAIAEVDARRVERVLRNLIGNAIEHSEGQPVVVTLGADESAVAVTVRDYGVGLKPGEEKLVFNRFWRADPSRARQTGGTGLGLSISLEDARLHGGWLEAWGSPGRGAQFRLVIPLRAGGRLTSSPLPLAPDDDIPPKPEVVSPDTHQAEAANTDTPQPDASKSEAAHA
jgi:two-component system sensor histidine kinase MtrB